MKGEGAKALQVVTSAALDRDYTQALAPLDKSMADIDEAAQRIAMRDYYMAPARRSAMPKPESASMKSTT
jgi:hypothetical protein